MRDALKPFHFKKKKKKILFPVESACQEEEDQARDQDPGEPARRDQHHPTGGHSQRPSGRFSHGVYVLLSFCHQEITGMCS